MEGRPGVDADAAPERRRSPRQRRMRRRRRAPVPPPGRAGGPGAAAARSSSCAPPTSCGPRSAPCSSERRWATGDQRRECGSRRPWTGSRCQPRCVNTSRRASAAAAGTTVSRELTQDLVVAADLVLTATREQRSAVVTRVPTALKRTFTLGEFAAWSHRSGARRSPGPPVDTLPVRAADPRGAGGPPHRRQRVRHRRPERTVGPAHRRTFALIEARTAAIGAGLLSPRGLGRRLTAPR